MEGAGKLIEDDELREAMREKGLGTPATRAQIIEGLHHRALHLSRGQGARAHREGVLADDAAARPRRAGAVLARAHRRVGVQARADGARQARARRVHARDRRDDAAHRRPGEELRERHHPRRLRDADGAVPEVRRRGAREVQEIPVHEACDFGFWKIMGGRQLEPGEAETLLARARGRPARRLPQQARPAVLGQAQAQRRQRGGVRLRRRARRRRRRGARLHRPGAARPVPEVRRAACSRRRWRTSARRPSGPTRRATSARAA